jgi:diguanylate cyclase (GGDEF)-like protein
MNSKRFMAPNQRLTIVWLLLALTLAWHSTCDAQTSLPGQWFAAPSGWTYHAQASLIQTGLQPVARIAATGGEFWYQASFVVDRDDDYVIDFKNSSVLGRFQHRLFDAKGMLIAELAGGIRSATANPFFLRHGREVKLVAGRYTLLTQIDSPFYLAEPTPYLDTLTHYRQAIKPGNALVLFCLGIFCGLGIYYTSLSVARRRTADRMYACFIFGNVLYNGTALLVLPELFNTRWFYLISVPILFSNIAYVFFVTALLEINATTFPLLHKVKKGCVAVLTLFVALAAVRPSWSLELDRYGVGVFLLFGFACGISSALRGNQAARLYLIANIAFLIPGLTSISLLQVQGLYTLYIEHLGLISVTIEVVLLALVLSYQFGLLYSEREHALQRAELHLRIACTDALTGLPNRYALETAVVKLPEHGTLTFVDLDGLKHYNDHFGHERGNLLLRSFAQHLAGQLGTVATAHRIGGDEFAITSQQGNLAFVEQALTDTIVALQAEGFELSGASFGSVRVKESAERNRLEHIADSRMYEHKRRRRLKMQDDDDFIAAADQA